MIYRFLSICAVIALFATHGSAQTNQWTTVRFGNLQCEFPKAYQKINFTDAGGIYYEGSNMYLTVTAQPDTSSMKGNLDRDYTRDFMLVVADVSRKLNGRVREFRDTVIANMPGYISKMEVTPKEGEKHLYYELLQVLQQDTMRSFSCQYYVDDPDGIKAANRLFSSIKQASKSASSGDSGNGLGKYGVWIGGGLLVIVGAWALLRWRNH